MSASLTELAFRLSPHSNCVGGVSGVSHAGPRHPSLQFSVFVLRRFETPPTLCTLTVVTAYV
jgi:hypothetical protein